MYNCFKITTVILFIIECCTTQQSGSSESWESEVRGNSERFGEKIDGILKNVLGSDDLQEYYDRLNFRRRELNGMDTLNQLATSFGQKFLDRNSAVKELQKVIENSLTRTSQLGECCKIDVRTFEMDDRFKQPIGNKACHRISSLKSEEKGYLSKKFEKACAENLQRMPSLRWQYFASESGITSLYPAVEVKDCDSYDGRFRPFYVQTNVPDPKDLVIVIDKSGSMNEYFDGRKLMAIAKDAAKTVVNTLNPHDEVAVIGFSDSVVLMGSTNEREKCFAEQLAQATSENVDTILQFVDEIIASGATNYAAALRKAFGYFENTPAKEERDRVILFLSDGRPTVGENRDIFEVISERNAKLNNSVVLMTYGIGNKDFSILNKMATQDGSSYGVENRALESIKVGLFTHVSKPSNLREAMGSYYQFFSKRTSDPLWTLPYLDKWGLGLMMSVTLPVYDNSGELAGVVATDLTLDDLLTTLVYSRLSELSYVFVIDEYGFVIYHPFFKYPEDHEVKYINIAAFETDVRMLDVIDDMKRGGEGSVVLQLERVSPGGASKLYGVNTLTVTTEVYWKQIPHTKLSLCLVLAKNDEVTTLQRMDPFEKDEFLYHRFDIVPPDSPCKHYENYCAKNQSAVSLGPRAFTDPDSYLINKEDESKINAMTSYMMKGRGGSTIRPGIRNSVWATQQAERFWKTHSDSDLEPYIMWRYVGTKEGALRIFPGSEMPKDYDATARPWYLNALARRGEATFTLPYEDAASGFRIISISKVIYEGKAGRPRNHLKDKVTAVMGVDLIVPFFQKLLEDEFPMCFQKEMENTMEDPYRCTLIDSAGFVMFGNTINQYSDIPEHITQVEPRIAQSLIDRDILTHSECMIMEKDTVQRTYKITGNEWFAGNTRYECDRYLFVPIRETNIYLIIRRSFSRCGNQDCFCSKFVTANGVRQCTSSSTSCECPCTNPYGDYNTCLNEFSYTGDNFPKPCRPDPKPLMKIGRNERGLENLPSCTPFSELPEGISTPTLEEDGNNNLGMLVGNVVGVGVFVIVVVVVFVVIAKKSRAERRRRFSSTRSLPQPPSVPSAPTSVNIYSVSKGEALYANSNQI